MNQPFRLLAVLGLLAGAPALAQDPDAPEPAPADAPTAEPASEPASEPVAAEPAAEPVAEPVAAEPAAETPAEVVEEALAEEAPVDIEPEDPWRPYGDVPMQPMPQSQGALTGDFQVLKRPFDFGGYFWVDTGMLKRLNGQAGDPNQDTLYMNGRAVLSAAYGTDIKDWFVMARLELMGLVNEFAKSAYEPHALDVFVRVGHKKWGDFTIGRFLGWQIYYRGQGIELFTAEEAGALDAPQLYLVDKTRGYRNEAGQAAFHFYPSKHLAFEVAGVYGQENSQNNLGVRPTMYFNVAGLVVVAGMEYQHQFNINQNDRVDLTQLGYGGQIRYTAGPLTLAANGSHLRQDRIDIQGDPDTASSFGLTSVGGVADLVLKKHAFGAAYHRTMRRNDRDEFDTQDQITASYLYRLPFEGLSVKAVYGYALANLENVDANQEWQNNLHSVRLRIMYAFD